MKIVGVFRVYSDNEAYKESARFLKKIGELNPPHTGADLQERQFEIEFWEFPDILRRINNAYEERDGKWEIASITEFGVTFYFVAPSLPRDAVVFVPMSNIIAINSLIDEEFLDDIHIASQQVN